MSISLEPGPRGPGPAGRPLRGLLLPLLPVLLVLLLLAPGPIAPGAPLASAPRAVAPSAAPVTAGRSNGAGSSATTTLLDLPGTASTTAMAYDSALGEMVLVAPDTSTTSPSADLETFVDSGGGWTRATPTASPPSREYAAMTYDASIGAILLFGGYAPDGAFLSDTWTFTGSTWTNVSGRSAVTPGARAAAALAYDAAGGFDLLFGGYGATGALSSGNLTDTWEYEDGNWSEVTGAGAPPLEGAMAYDAALSEVVYYGGVTELGGCSSATYAFENGTWTRILASDASTPGALAMTSMTYDAALGGMLLFGGACGVGIAGIALTLDLSSATYVLGATGWSEVTTAGAPPASYGADIAFGPVVGGALLFGGESAAVSLGTTSTHLLGATYLFANASWGVVRPVLLASRALAEVGQNETLRLEGVVTPGATYVNFTGLPTGASVAGASAAMTLAEAGTLHPSVNVTTTLGFGSGSTVNATANTTVVVLARHVVDAFSASRSETEVGVPIDLTASVSGGEAGGLDLFTDLPGGCVSANVTTLSCTPTLPGTWDVEFESTDALGVTATALTLVAVAARLTVSALTLERPAIDLGMLANASWRGTGGVGPLEASFSGLPPGCDSVNATALSCTPDTTGSFAMTAEVSDALGVTSNASATMTVNPDPRITAMAVTGPALVVGTSASLNFSVAATGGTGTIAYLVRSLPPGCVLANVAVIACRPTEPGTFAVVVSATDALGWTVTDSTNLTVTEHSVTGGGPGPSSAGLPYVDGVAAVGLLFAVLAGAVGGRTVQRRREGARLARELEEGVAAAPSDLFDDLPPGGGAR